jgi:prevent-host-death family protein
LFEGMPGLTVFDERDILWLQYVAIFLWRETAMAEVGIRELKNRTSEIVREVREERAEYVITYRGRPVARIVPVVAEEEDEQALQELERLSQEISAQWKLDRSAVDLLTEMRR